MTTSTYRKHAEDFVDVFSVMVERAKRRAFPALRKHFGLSPEIESESRWTRIVNLIASPFDPSIRNQLGPLLWILAFSGLFSLNMVFGYRLLARTWGSSGQETTASTFGWAAFVIFTIVTSVVTIPMTYIYSWWLFRTKHYRLIHRRVFITLYGIWAIVVSCSVYGWIANTTAITYKFSWVSFAWTSLYMLALLFPLITFTYLGLFNLLLWIRLILLGGGKYFLSVHTARPTEDILDLVFDNSDQSNDASWHLIDLSTEKIQSLHNWASANRESSDKRLLPVAVVFAFFSLFTNVDEVNNFLAKTFGWWWKALSFHAGSDYSLCAFLEYIGAILLFALIVMFLRGLVDLFSNLVIQSLIIEACVVAEHVHAQELSTSQEETQLEKVESNGCLFFWRRR
jgi:hypothetical protein